MVNLVHIGNRIRGETLFHLFNVCLNDGTVVGECNLRVGGDNFYSGNVGYRINEEYRNQGYATAAVKELGRLAQSFGVTEILICCAPDNIPSRRVAEKLGANYLGNETIPDSHELYAYGRRVVSRYVLKSKELTDP